LSIVFALPVIASLPHVAVTQAHLVRFNLRLLANVEASGMHFT